MNAPTAMSTSPKLPPPAAPRRWLFSPTLDLLAFAGSAVVALALCVIAVVGGLPALTPAWLVTTPIPESPAWVWVVGVLLVDVAHVWGTGVLVYFDAAERRRRRLLYRLTPLVCLVVLLALASEGDAVFWRVLAYVAAFHFVRQQQGFVRLFHAQAPGASSSSNRSSRLAEASVVMAAVGPLLWWHTRLPHSPIAWFVDGDFVPGLPGVVGVLALVVEGILLVAYVVQSARAHRAGVGQPGRDLVIATTALTWGLGIVVLENDVAFTLLNVMAHGVPYMILVIKTAQSRRRQRGTAAPMVRAGVVGVGLILLTLWVCAYVEELGWSLLLTEEHRYLLPEGVRSRISTSTWEILDLARRHDLWRTFFLAFLSLPQVVHYVLDGFIWRRRENPDVAPTV